VGTAKRERQKANRQLRLEELAKQARKQKSKRVGLRIGIILGAVVALVGALVLFGGDDDDTSSTSTSLDASTTLPVDVSTTLVRPKPEVKLPEELPTELVITDIVEGEGDPAEAGDTVSVRYVGVLSATGEEFDSNFGSPTPFDVVLGQGNVIQGWDEGLIGVKAGGTRQLDIPADLAYGDNPQPGSIIQAGDALTFVVEVEAVTPPPPPTISEFTYGTGECPEADGSSPKTSTFADAPQLCIDPTKQYTATFETSKGTIVVELDMSVPGTVNNFVTLARYHYYDGTVIFRADPSIDIIQGGGLTNTDSPGYTIPDEGTGFRYAEGSLSMARTGAPNSAGGQWFFSGGPATSVLDGQGTYVVFGNVTEGLDVVQAILALAGGDDGQTPTEEVTLITVTITES